MSSCRIVIYIYIFKILFKINILHMISVLKLDYFRAIHSNDVESICKQIKLIKEVQKDTYIYLFIYYTYDYSNLRDKLHHYINMHSSPAEHSENEVRCYYYVRILKNVSYITTLQ